MNGLPMYGIMIMIIGLVFWRRTRAMVRPIQGSGIKLLIPILYLLPAILAFIDLHSQLKIWEIGIAAFAGVLLAVPLVLTTNYEIRQDGQIYAQKNKSFFIALIAVLVIRIAARQYFGSMEPASLMLLFFTVAFSYIVPWRIVSFVKFRKVKLSQTAGDALLPVKVKMERTV